MIVKTPDTFRQAVRDNAFEPTRPAAMRAALLVSPAGFHLESESAKDNRYMALDQTVDADRAMLQHQKLAADMMQCGVPVLTIPGRADLPDGVFPNNVFATARNRFIIGAMRHSARRGEAGRSDVRELFTGLFGYELVDLSDLDGVAELTGPMVIDRARNIGFCGLTERADEAGCAAMHEAFGLDLTFQFDLAPTEYHTNVIMAMLADRGVVLHPGSFADPSVPEAIAGYYGDGAVLLDDDEKAAFAGNCIAVTDRDLFMSEGGAERLRPQTRRAIESLGFTLHGVVVDELEKAGGSLRCLVAEIF